MADIQDRVSIELIDAGEHKDRVVLVLSKVKGLAQSPQQIVSSTPSTVATEVPCSAAEKLKGYLEKAGAMVMLEGPQEQAAKLQFTSELPAQPDLDFPEPTPAMPAEPTEVDESPYSASAFTEPPGTELFKESEELPLPDMPASSELAEMSDVQTTAKPAAGFGAKLHTWLAKLPRVGGKQPQRPQLDDAPIPVDPTEGQPAPHAAQFSLAALANVFQRKPKSAPVAPLASMATARPETPDTSPELSPLPAEPVVESSRAVKSIVQRMPNILSQPISLAIVGFLVGVLIAGVWGRFEISRLKQQQDDYEAETAQKILAESTSLKNLVQTLQVQNQELGQQLAAQKTGQPTAITPVLATGQPNAAEQDLILAFQALATRHAQNLQKSYDAQKQTGCTLQVMLDGTGSATYAQVVKKFDAQYNRVDILRSASILSPYAAELKIAFHEEVRTGKTLAACEAAPLKQLETPPHHEFGGYYGYWTIEYHYVNGAWVANTTVVERNRALYERSFERGSPDFAKFSMDPELLAGDPT